MPDFSNRDAVYNDLAAPGAGILSTFPRALTAKTPGLRRPGLLRLRPARVPGRRGHVVRRAAGLRGGRAAARAAARPDAGPGRLRSLERTADDVNAASGCRKCALLPRLALRLGPPRRGRGARRARRRRCRRADALRDERRRRRRRRARSTARTRTMQRHARLLGRPDVDVYRVYLRKRPAPVRDRVRARRGATRPAALEARARRTSTGSRSPCSFARRPLAAAGPGRAPRATARRRPAGTTSRSRSRRRARAPTRSRFAKPLSRLLVSSSSSSGTSRSTRAGLPTTTTRGGTSRTTTAPAPTNASSPISIPGQRIAPPPTRAPRRIVGPRSARAASRCGP